MKGLTTEIEVGSLLKQYVEKFLKQDVLIMGNGWVLSDIIKPYLELNSRDNQTEMFDDKKTEKEKNTIKIMLPMHSTKISNKKSKKNYWLNPFYRVYVSPQGQAMVRRHLKKMMRQSFRVYMDGYTAAWEELDKSKVKSGVIAFFMEYEIEWNKNDENALSRDWLRYRSKKYDGRICPILF